MVWKKEGGKLIRSVGGWEVKRQTGLVLLIEAKGVYSSQSVDPSPLCRLPLCCAPLPAALEAQTVEAKRAMEFKMIIKDAGAFATLDQVKMLLYAEVQFILGLPHIQLVAGPAPDGIDDVTVNRS